MPLAVNVSAAPLQIQVSAVDVINGIGKTVTYTLSTPGQLLPVPVILTFI